MKPLTVFYLVLILLALTAILPVVALAGPHDGGEI